MRIIKIYLVCFLFILLTVSVFGWSRHNLLTREILSEVEWLRKYDNITVTPYTYSDNTINPDFKIYYEPTAEMKQFPKDGEFFDYYIDNGSFYGYRGKKLGEKTTAFEILCDYSDEPDWEMDKNMRHGFNQKFMGGPQGFRHMYYPLGTFKVSNFIFPQGDAPNRTEYYFQKAKAAFKKGDQYWGFRFLARSIHYLEDMGQPYHTRQTSTKFIHWNDPIKSTTTVTKNYHAVWEVYFGNVTSFESTGKTSIHPLIPYLKAGKIEPVSSPKSLAIKTAKRSTKLAPKSFNYSILFFGQKYNVLELKFIDEKEFLELYQCKGEHSILLRDIHRVCGEAYKITSTAVLSFLQFAKKECNL